MRQWVLKNEDTFMNSREVFDLSKLPETSNLALAGPFRLTLEEFHAIPVTEQVMCARTMIYRLEEMINSMEDSCRIDQDTLTPIHRFTNGIYSRELTMPAGTIIVGKRHAQEHLVTMTKGFCTCITERGWEDLNGSITFVSPAGEKRVLFVHEETTWITTHRTDAKTLELAEKELILSEHASIPHKYKKEIQGVK